MSATPAFIDLVASCLFAIAIVHTFGGTRDDLMQALALAEAGRVQTHVEVYDLEAAGRVLADLDAGNVLGRAVLVP